MVVVDGVGVVVGVVVVDEFVGGCKVEIGKGVGFVEGVIG